MTTVETIKNNGEIFYKSNYNGVAVLVRKSDRYVNASKLGNKSRPARNYINQDKFGEICEYWLKTRSAGNPSDPEMPAKYVLTGVSNDLKGTYIHPELVHFVAEWVDIKYSFAVADLMNKINEYTHKTNKTFEEAKNKLIQNLQQEIDELKETNTQLTETVETQEQEITNTSTRTPNNSDKDLYIIKSEKGMKLCADSTHRPSTFIHHYIFPATMNMKQDIKNNFNLKYYIIPEEKYNDIIDFIEENNPKLIE